MYYKTVKSNQKCFIASNISVVERTYCIVQFADGSQEKMRRDNLKKIKKI